MASGSWSGFLNRQPKRFDGLSLYLILTGVHFEPCQGQLYQYLPVHSIFTTTEDPANETIDN